MGSSGGGTTKTTSDPWGGQQPYLQDVFNKASQVFGNAWNQGVYNAPQSPLYQNYINQAGNQQVPGGAALPAALQQGLNAPAALTPQIAGVIGSAYDPGLGQRLSDMLRSGYSQNVATPGLLGAAGSQWAQPYANALAGAGGAPNPYIRGTAQTAALGMANPALAQLNATAQGQYLTPETNPYLQKSVQNALEQAKATIASQFNQGGRYGSGMMAGIQAQELGKIATGAYSNAYEQERARQLNAQQALGSQFLQGAGLLQQGQQQAGQLTQGAQGQAISGLSAAGQLAGQQQQLGQSALTSAGQLSSDDLNRQLQAQQLATSGYLQNIQNQMQSQQAGLSGMLDAYRLQQQTAQGTAPAIQSMENERLAQLANAAGVQQSLLQMPEQTAWDRLANYLSMIQGSYGSTVSQKTPQPSLLNQVAGGAIATAPYWSKLL